jgi:RNA polymerase sigma factor (TIGR02999 family)
MLLARWRKGDRAALEQLTEALYGQLRRLAASYMTREKQSHTLCATAVVHEAYLRMLGKDLEWQDRAHFLALAAREMRRLLVDHARGKNRDKRGGEWQRISFTSAGEGALGGSQPIDVLAVEEALTKLESFDERKARITDLIVFGGLTIPETAAALGVSEATVNRDWRMAKAWLQHELKAGSS